MANKRVFYATQAIAFKKSTAVGGIQTSAVLPLASSGVNASGLWEVPRGVQSVSTTTTFNLEQLFQLGQLELYENQEELPDIELSVSKVLDGSRPLYLMTSDDGGQAAGSVRSLSDRNSNYRTDCVIHTFPDTNIHASGTTTSRMYASGLYMSSVSYTFPVDGNATEEISYVGNDKFWATADGGTADNSLFPNGVGLISTDEDPSTFPSIPSPGATRREDFDIDGSTLPSTIPTADREAIQNITVSADFGRDEIFALGQKDVFHRYLSFPISVTSSFEVVTSEGDLIEAVAERDNLTDETIILKTTQGLIIDLGTKNKLSSIDFGGADAGAGDNATVTYSYETFNTLDISHSFFP